MTLTQSLRILFGNCAACVALVSATFADTENEEKNTDESEQIEEIVVRAHPLNTKGMVGDVLVVSTIHDEARVVPPGNLGQTVEQVPGVRNASFGEGVGQVMVQGLDGPRVMYLYDRLPTMDSALSSRDHPPMLDPMVAEQVEILKGPSTLLYGTGASGGIVNLESGRIPRDLGPGYPTYKLWAHTRDNGGMNSQAIRLNTVHNNSLALHVDYFRRGSDDYSIPGCAESKYYVAREEEHEEEEDDHHHDAEDEQHADEEHHMDNCGTLIDSDVESNVGFALGLSFIGQWGYVGASISQVSSKLGVPIEHHHEDHGHEEEEMHDDHDDDDHEMEERERVYIDLNQMRFDGELKIFAPLNFIEEIEFRVASGDYDHDEVAGTLVETTYKRDDATELRIVAKTQPQRDWTHAFGFQRTADQFKFSALNNQGNPTTTTKNGLFWLGNRKTGNTDYQVGLRWDGVNLNNQIHGSFDFSLVSASSAVIHQFTPELRVRVALDYSSRAPMAEEIFVEGTHLFTGSTLIPNLALNEENMIAPSIVLNYDLARWSLDVTAYYRSIENFIYESPTGAVDEDLPVYQFVEHDTTFIGADLAVQYEWIATANWEVNTFMHWDTVNSEIRDGPSQHLPRTPSNRTVMGVDFVSGRLWGRVEFEHNGEVNDVPEYILPTDAYSDVSVDLEYELLQASFHGAIALRIRNLFDEEQRPHTSAIKDVAPLPGRSIELGITIFN